MQHILPFLIGSNSRLILHNQLALTVSNIPSIQWYIVTVALFPCNILITTECSTLLAVHMPEWTKHWCSLLSGNEMAKFVWHWIEEMQWYIKSMLDGCLGWWHVLFKDYRQEKTSVGTQKLCQETCCANVWGKFTGKQWLLISLYSHPFSSRQRKIYSWVVEAAVHRLLGCYKILEIF